MNLHLISFNVPYPPDYGGVIDVFYKIKALKDIGVDVHLHSYEYGRTQAEELLDYCKTVTYYKRNSGFKYTFKTIPYIVSTRNSRELVDNLKKDNFPIIYEGLHTTYPLFLDSLGKERIQVVRSHNIEHNYYRGLASLDQNLFSKIFHAIEALRLKPYEKVLHKASGIAAISNNDSFYLNQEYGKTKLIAAFHRFDELTAHTGYGDYCLYHSDLSVIENHQVAEFLIKKVFADLDFKLIIAGRNPSPSLYNLVKKTKNVSLFANLSREYLDKLIQEAQVNILPVFFSNGIKLKLLSALYQGRHCLVNTPMVEGTGLESLCHIANTEMEFVEKIIKLMFSMFDERELIRRRKILESEYSNKENAQKLVDFIQSLS